MQYNNPFSYEKQNKKFFQQLQRVNLQGLNQQDRQIYMNVYQRLHYTGHYNTSYQKIKRLNQQVQNIKSYQPTQRVRGQSEIKIHSVLKEKRQTISQFVKKKRQICLKRMYIEMKQKAINNAQSQVDGQQNTLQVRRLLFLNDRNLVRQLIQSIKNAATSAKIQYDEQKKLQTQLIQRQLKLINQEQKYGINIERAKVQKESLQSYRDFLQKIKPKEMILKLQRDKINHYFYLTQTQKCFKKEQNKYFFPQDLIQKLNALQESNLVQIQNKYDAQEEEKRFLKEIQHYRISNKKAQYQFHQRKKILIQTLEQAQITSRQLTSLKKNNTSKNYTAGTDNQLDMSKIGNLIQQIHRQMNSTKLSLGKDDLKQKQQEHIPLKSDQLKQLLKQIQLKVCSDLKHEVNKQQQRHKKITNSKEHRIKLQDQESQPKRESKPREREVMRGRKDVFKRIEQKVKSHEKKVQIKKEENNEKYFKQ